MRAHHARAEGIQAEAQPLTQGFATVGALLRQSVADLTHGVGPEHEPDERDEQDIEGERTRAHARQHELVRERGRRAGPTMPS